MRTESLPTARLIAFGLPLALLAGALGFEHLGGLIPCEMCHWQRWPHYAAVVVAAMAFLPRRRSVQKMFVVIAALLIALSGAIAVAHAGVEYHWWQGFTACTTMVSGGDPMEMLNAAIRAPMVRCDQPQWSLFGISMAGYNALLSLGGALVILVLALKRGRR